MTFLCMFRQIKRGGAEDDGEFRRGRCFPPAYLSNALRALCVKIASGFAEFGL